MGETTGISWTHCSANKWTGCAHASSGCANCYAEALGKRRGLGWGEKAPRVPVKAWSGHLRRFRRLAADPEWRAKRNLAPGERPRVFLSIQDPFEDHPDLPALRREMWEDIREYDDLCFLLLTKRPQNIPGMLPEDWGHSGWDHVWLGTSIESGEEDVLDNFTGKPVISRAEYLCQVPAPVRFVSYEPAIGPLTGPEVDNWSDLRSRFGSWVGLGINWVIYGGESGPRRRPEGTEEDPQLWARRVLGLCSLKGVPFFHKQRSALRPGQGPELDGEIVQQVPGPDDYIDKYGPIVWDPDRQDFIRTVIR